MTDLMNSQNTKNNTTSNQLHNHTAEEFSNIKSNDEHLDLKLIPIIPRDERNGSSSVATR